MRFIGYISKTVIFLSSKEFLFLLAGGWIFYYVLSSIWTEQVFAGFISGIGGNPAIQVPYILFLAAGILNTIRISLKIIKRGRIRFLVWIILPLGSLVFLTGFFLSIHNRQAGQRMVGEGDIIRPPWVSETYRVDHIEPGLRPSIVDIEEEAGIFAHEPTLTLIDRSMRRYVVGAFPARKIKDTYYHILNFGIAPGIRLVKDERVVHERYLPLRILTFGSSDFFEIRPFPFSFMISMEPEKTFLKEDTLASEFNLRMPVYRVRVLQGEKVIAEGDSRQEISFDDFTLSFFEPTFWILLEAVRDPALPVLLTGIFLVIAGIPSTFGLFIFELLRRGIRPEK
jgi:hypothetical protein